MSHRPWDLYVFRSPRREVSFRELAGGILADACAGRLVDALVRAGEVESALADAEAPSAGLAAAVTDALASCVLRGDGEHARRVARDLVADADARSGKLRVVPPEAFSYYALDPRDVADRIGEPDLAQADRVAVVGLRSIGTTMSAVACAAVRLRGGAAERRTVRPIGEPYDRVTPLRESDVAWARAQLTSGARLVVVDEGPGMSGSSLLSAVDAFAELGFPRERITILCTRAPDPTSLLARDGAARWSAVRSAVIASRPRLPAGATRLDAGTWRARFLEGERQWPGCWSWLERVKGMSGDGRTLFKFEGLGRYGAEGRQRANAVAEAGFGPRTTYAGDGWAAYDVVAGRPARPTTDGPTIERLADYCAWRAAELRSDASRCDIAAMEDMARKNAEIALGAAPCRELCVVRPVIADAKMMPYEWIVSEAGLVKTDAASHGDDHIFPGPTDVAWDLAGAIVEWRLSREGAAHFLRRYAQRSGDPVHARLPAWLVAYALHRLAYSELAAANTPAESERARLVRDARRYRRWLRVAAGQGWMRAESQARQASQATASGDALGSTAAGHPGKSRGEDSVSAP